MYNIKNTISNNYFLYHKINSNEYSSNMFKLMNQLDINNYNKNTFEDFYLFNKIVGICTKKGKKQMAFLQVINALKIIKQFFRINPFYFLKISVLQIEPFIFLHKIPKGNKETIYPRILPTQTRIHNSLYLIVKQAYNNNKSFKSFSHSLAYSIIDNSMPENIYKKKVKDIIEIAELNKRNIKLKRKGIKKLITKIRRKERFKLFRKIKVWK